MILCIKPNTMQSIFCVKVKTGATCNRTDNWIRLRTDFFMDFSEIIDRHSSVPVNRSHMDMTSPYVKICSKSLLGFFSIVPKLKHWLWSRIQCHATDKGIFITTATLSNSLRDYNFHPPIRPKNSVASGSRNFWLNALHHQARYIHMVCVVVRFVVVR